MSRRISRCALILALIVGPGLSALPIVPIVEYQPLVQTRLQRLDIAHRSELDRGELRGDLLLAGPDDAPVLTLGAGSSGTYTSPPLELGLAATSLAAHWWQSGPIDEVAVSFRASPDGRDWSPWQSVEEEGGTADGDGRRAFSTLASADGARVAQFQVALTRGGLLSPAVRAITVFALDSASAHGRSVPRLRLAPVGSAQAAIKPLGIVSRVQWGADESLRFAASRDQTRGEIWPEEVRKVEKVVVHHTDGPNVCSSPDPYCQRRSIIGINDIYHYHTVVNGWGDIGYNSLIGYDGRIYEGRHGPEPVGDREPIAQPVVAGHALSYNNRSHGVALMGNFELEPVPDHQFDALERLVSWIVTSQLASARIDPLGASDYVRGDGKVHPGLLNIIGHRDVNATECPGEFLYQRLGALRERVKRLVEWPPIAVELRARPVADGVEYHILVDNHEPELVQRLTIKGAVPPNVEFVDSWAGPRDQNHGVFDGSTVTWYDPEGRLRPGSDRREYVFLVRPRPGVARSAVRTTAWVQFSDPRPGVSMSEAVGADQPIVSLTDRAAGGRVTWNGTWLESRNVEGYFGNGYQVQAAGTGTASYTWEVELFEPGRYEVFAWWTAAPDRARNAPYTLLARDGAHTVRVNQTQAGARWVSLGTFAFDAGRPRVTLSDDANGYVVADAIRFRRRP